MVQEAEGRPTRIVRRAAIGVALLLLMTPFLAGWLAYSNLQRAVDASDRAEKELGSRRGDVAGLLRGAIADTDHARQLLVDPVLRGLGAVTGTGDDLTAAHNLAGIAGDAIAVGLDVWHDLEELGPQLYPGGRIDFETVADLDQRVSEHAGEIAALQRRLASTDRGSLEVVDAAFERAERQLDSTRSALASALDALGILPELFGRDGKRRYLVTFLTPSEARGGGGLLGVFSVLSANNGRLDLGEIHTNDDINDHLKKPVRAPRWFADLYGNLTALDDVRQANLSISFPATSRVMLEMYRKVFGEKLDGLIAMDPVALGQLSRALGPLSARGWDVTIKPSNARKLLLHDIYLEFPLSAEGRQNAYLARLVDKVWNKVNGGDFPIGAMGAAFAEAASTQHLKVFMANPQLQSVVRELGIGADPTLEAPNVQAFFHNNFAGNKIDYHIERTQHIDIELSEDGSARVAAEVEMVNDAPAEPATLINRPLNENLPIGLARMTIHFLLPQSARVISAEIDGRRTQFLRGTDSGFPARWSTLNIEAGDETTVRIEYETEFDPMDEHFEFTLWPQALPFPDRYEISVSLPPGSSIDHHNFGKRDNDRLTSTGALKTPRTFTIDF